MHVGLFPYMIICTGCPKPLPLTPPQQNWPVPHPKPINLHDPTSIPDQHARPQIINLICPLPVTYLLNPRGANFC